MTHDDIIQLYEKANGWSPAAWPNTVEGLARFAALVAAAEREKVARWQIGSGYSTGHGETIEDLLVELEWQVRESEREACAKVCEELLERPSGYQGRWEGYGKFKTQMTGQECAAAIRARGGE